MAIRDRYRRASKEEKGIILQGFSVVCQYSRKYAIRLLNSTLSVPKWRRGPEPMYADGALVTALKRLWLATDQMCSEKLVAAIPAWLPFYE